MNKNGSQPELHVTGAKPNERQFQQALLSSLRSFITVALILYLLSDIFIFIYQISVSVCKCVKTKHYYLDIYLQLLEKHGQFEEVCCYKTNFPYFCLMHRQLMCLFLISLF